MVTLVVGAYLGIFGRPPFSPVICRVMDECHLKLLHKIGESKRH